VNIDILSPADGSMVDASDPKGLPFHVRVDGINLPDDGFAQVKAPVFSCEEPAVCSLDPHVDLSCQRGGSAKWEEVESVETCGGSEAPGFSVGSSPR
jgi:hypothetical protein